MVIPPPQELHISGPRPIGLAPNQAQNVLAATVEMFKVHSEVVKHVGPGLGETDAQQQQQRRGQEL